MKTKIIATPSLLPHQPAPITRDQLALTKRFLIPSLKKIYDYLYALRDEMDPALYARYTMAYGKEYPLGCCLEITDTVRQELVRRLQKPQLPAERALHAFFKAGGIMRPIWGALRGQFFQNATQIGTLYVDVSNDTVTVTKPKVEILPIDQSGLEAIRDLHHYRDVARLYWNCEIMANHAVPALAPLMPMMGVRPGEAAQLMPPLDYMTALVMRDRFQMSEAWLRDVPSPAPEVLEPFLRVLPAHLRPAPGLDVRAAAIDACRVAREQGMWQNQEWRSARILDYFATLSAARGDQGGLSSANSSTSPVAASAPG